MTDERTPYVDTKVPKRLVPLVRQSLRLILESDEQMFGLFAVVRIRRSISLLVVTDRRLLTLGDEHVSLPLVDEVRRADVREVTIERTKVWTAGLVTARTIHGEEVNLGVLNVVDSSTFLRLEEVLARPTGPSTMPTIPTPGVEVGPGARGSRRQARLDRPRVDRPRLDRPRLGGAPAGRPPERAGRPPRPWCTDRGGVHHGQGPTARRSRSLNLKLSLRPGAAGPTQGRPSRHSPATTPHTAAPPAPPSSRRRRRRAPACSPRPAGR